MLYYSQHDLIWGLLFALLESSEIPAMHTPLPHQPAPPAPGHRGCQKSWRAAGTAVESESGRTGGGLPCSVCHSNPFNQRFISAHHHLIVYITPLASQNPSFIHTLNQWQSIQR